MSFPWMHCPVFTIGSGPACGATGKTKSQAMTSVVPFGLQAAMTANERAGRGLHGSAGGSEGALEEGVWGRNLEKVSLPLARPNQASSGWHRRPFCPPRSTTRVSRVCHRTQQTGGIARSPCHTSVLHDGADKEGTGHAHLSTPKTFPAKHAADSQAPSGTTSGVPLPGSR